MAALVPLSGCGLVRQIAAAPVDGLSTVVRVTWTTSADLDGYVEFGPLDDCDRYRTPLVGTGSDHEVLLLGLPPATEACYKIVATDGDFTWPEPSRRVQTGNLPAAVPDLRVPLYERGLVQDGFFLAASGTNPGLVLILDRDGQVVWYQPADEGYVSPQAHPDPATGGYIYNRFSKDFAEDVGTVRRVGQDGAEVEEVRTPLAHHSFELLDDGTIAWLAIDVRNTDDWDAVVGDAVREVSAAGKDSVVWSSWDDWQIQDLDESSREFYPQGADWTHGNFLSWDEQRQTYTVSFRNVNTIVEMNRDGDILRGIGEYGDHDMGELEGLVQYPHSAYWTETGTLLFTTTPHDDEETRAVELAFDPDARSVEQVWSWGEGQGYYAKVLGEAIRLDNGNRLVNFGSQGVVVEVTEEGEEAWRLEAPTGYFPGHLTFIRDLYDPAGQDGDG